MAAETILRPDNRLLSFSAADFSNYGAQPDPVLTIRPLGTPDAVARASETEVHSNSPVGYANGSVGLTAGVADEDSSAQAVPDHAELGVSPSASISPNSAPADSAHTSSADPAAQPVSGSGTPPGLLDGSHAVASDDHVSLDANLASGIASAPIETVQDVASSSLGTVAGGLPHLGVADATTAFVVQAVGDTAATATGAAEAAVDNLVTGADNVAAGATDVATGIADAATAAPATVEADIAQLTGTDPAAGVATLVNLIAADNLFDLRDAGAAPDGADGGASSIDQLIGDAAETSPLLGDAAHHDDGSAPTDTLDVQHDGFGL